MERKIWVGKKEALGGIEEGENSNQNLLYEKIHFQSLKKIFISLLNLAIFLFVSLIFSPVFLTFFHVLSFLDRSLLELICLFQSSLKSLTIVTSELFKSSSITSPWSSAAEASVFSEESRCLAFSKFSCFCEASRTSVSLQISCFILESSY